MFADIAKMALKASLVAIVTAAVLAVFATVQIPAIDMTSFQQAIGMGKAMLQYWVPGYNIILTLGLTLLLLQVAVIAFRVSAIAFRWLFKVNE